MERADLLEANGAIFKPQGEALNAGAADDVQGPRGRQPGQHQRADRACSNAPDIPAERFTAMTRLDENRAVAQLAQKLGVGVDDVQDLVVWGNHSPTMFPDLFNAKVNGERAADQVDMDWYENEYIPRVGKRGAEIIEARGASSAASAANAAIDHVRDWVARRRRPALDGRAAQAASTASRRASSRSFPVRCQRRRATRSSRASRSATSRRRKIDTTVNELKEERDAVQGAGPRLTDKRF